MFVTPAVAHQREIRIPGFDIFYRSTLVSAEGVAPVQDQLGYAFRAPGRVRDCDRTALRDSE